MIYVLWSEGEKGQRGFLVAKKAFWKNGYCYTNSWRFAQTFWTLEGCKTLLPGHKFHQVEVITVWRWIYRSWRERI